MNEFVSVAKEMEIEAVQGIKKELGKIAVIIQILIPVLLCLFLNNKLFMLLLSSVCVCVTSYLRRVGDRINRRKDGIPLPPCKFIKRERGGIIGIEAGKEELVVLYLAELEEYFDKKGINYEKVVDMKRKG